VKSSGTATNVITLRPGRYPHGEIDRRNVFGSLTQYYSAHQHVQLHTTTFTTFTTFFFSFLGPTYHNSVITFVAWTQEQHLASL